MEVQVHGTKVKIHSNIKKSTLYKYIFLIGVLHTVEWTETALDGELVWFAATENQLVAV